MIETPNMIILTEGIVHFFEGLHLCVVGGGVVRSHGMYLVF